MSIKNPNGQDFEIDFDELVKIITEEVVNHLYAKGGNFILNKETCTKNCSKHAKSFNPSCCSVTEISREYIMSIRSEVSSIMAL